MALASVASTGLYVIYEPQDAEPVADIVFVHGLQGDPIRTWSWKGRVPSSSDRALDHPQVPYCGEATCSLEEAIAPKDSSSTEPKGPTDPLYSKVSQNVKVALNAFSTLKRKRSSPETKTDSCSDPEHRKAVFKEVFWPGELLPRDCARARILTWGYDSKVTRFYTGPTNKNDIFSHAQDLLCALSARRPPNRPIIFVAHSLGGIIVKDLLRRSEAAKEEEKYQDIVASTVAVIFFGTPHRGSADKAALGDTVRRTASSLLRFDSNPTLLRALGVDSPELELGRQEFSRLWNSYKFRVKTFQESLGMLGVNLGGLNSKVVSDVSSSLDNPLERKETILANHRNMCRFSGPTDPEYQKVVHEMRAIFDGLSSRPEKGLKACLEKLNFDELEVRELNTPAAFSNTCSWVFEMPEYLTWLGRVEVEKHRGLLWIRGTPGAGKSVIMKEACQRARKEASETTTVAHFFFNARGSQLERSPLGLLRALLFQMIQQDKKLESRIMSLYWRNEPSCGKHWEWQERDLRQVLEAAATAGDHQRAMVFVDALDKCDPNLLRDMVDFFRTLANSALVSGWNLNVCISSRHYPNINIPWCLNIIVEHGNHEDIKQYVQAKLQVAAQPSDITNLVQEQILRMASGVFFWVVLVVKLLHEDLEDGKTVRDILLTLKTVPSDLAELFEKLFLTLKPHERSRSVTLFQWVLLAEWPLSPQEVCLALGFNSATPHRSLEGWERSIDRVPNDEQARRLIRSHSRGLIGFSFRTSCGEIVEFIHESVREYLLTGQGFTHLDKGLKHKGIGIGYHSMTDICLNLLKVRELGLSIQRERISPFLYRYYGPLFYAAVNLIHHAKQAENHGFVPKPFLKTLTLSKSDLWQRMKWMRYSHGQTITNTDSFSALQLRLSEGGSALYDLCTLEFLPSVKKLLQHGADPNAKGGDLSYPLLAAVQNSRSSKHLVRALLERGAQVNASGRRCQTALHQASSLGFREVAAVLLAFGAEIDCMDDEYKTPLHLAVEHDHCEMVAFLLTKGADPDVWSYEMSSGGQHFELSPLHMAVLNRSLPMVKTLVSGHAGLEIYDNNNKTPYDMACERHDGDIRDYLEQAMKKDAEPGMKEAFNNEMSGVEGFDHHWGNLSLQSPRMSPNASRSGVTNEAVAYRPAVS